MKSRDLLSSDAAELEGLGAKLVLGGHAETGEADLIVVSPGVPRRPEIDLAERAGIPVIGEIELAVSSLRHPCPIVAIGGTNGKSTTTSLVGAMLEAAGKKTFTGGNLGE